MNTYIPKVDDYVKYDDLEGWIYFIDEEYFTLEIMTREKSLESYNDSKFHRNYRCLVLVYREDWKDLIFIKNRWDK